MPTSETVPTTTLPSGANMPVLGLGVFLMPPGETQKIAEQALAVGYRFIDTAAQYQNEAEVGRAIATSGIGREDLFIATKVANPDHGFDKTLVAAQKSLDKLGLDQVDLYLMHWPAPKRGLYVETWQALIELQRQGMAKDIGVCNFMPEHLDTVISETGVTPAVNQIELHPAFQQTELREYHAKHSIVTQGWGPLGQGKYPLDFFPVLGEIAQRKNKTAHQVVIRWHVQNSVVIFPKASSKTRLLENLDVFDFSLSDQEMDDIAALDVNFRLGNNPYFRN